MNAMAPTRPAVLHRHRVSLTAGPAAAGQARGQVRAAICTWDVPVDADLAILLASELVTNAIRHEAGETITLAISCSQGEFRVEVHDTSCTLPVPVDAPLDAETGRGLLLVNSLSAEWGSYRTPGGKAVYFTLAFEPELDRFEPNLDRGRRTRPARRSHVGPVRRYPSAIHRAH
jgi:anti-sigma regulatory factor (Ser/Thr protein kinase)